MLSAGAGGLLRCEFAVATATCSSTERGDAGASCRWTEEVAPSPLALSGGVGTVAVVLGSGVFGVTG
jgi:hypothetical protein